MFRFLLWPLAEAGLTTGIRLEGGTTGLRAAWFEQQEYKMVFDIITMTTFRRLYFFIPIQEKLRLTRKNFSKGPICLSWDCKNYGLFHF